MKKLLVLLTLLAAFASFGCGSDEPAADACPVISSSRLATTKTETTITEKQSKTKTAADKEMEKIEEKHGGRPMVGQPKAGDTIHHFSK